MCLCFQHFKFVSEDSEFPDNREKVSVTGTDLSKRTVLACSDNGYGRWAVLLLLDYFLSPIVLIAFFPFLLLFFSLLSSLSHCFPFYLVPNN